jgi:hypothetical protein
MACRQTEDLPPEPWCFARLASPQKSPLVAPPESAGPGFDRQIAAEDRTQVRDLPGHKNENPNRRWGYLWRRRELKTAQGIGPNAIVHRVLWVSVARGGGAFCRSASHFVATTQGDA